MCVCAGAAVTPVQLHIQPTHSDAFEPYEVVCRLAVACVGDWQLLWTSEASVHGIVRGLVPVTDITQCIDLK